MATPSAKFRIHAQPKILATLFSRGLFKYSRDEVFRPGAPYCERIYVIAGEVSQRGTDFLGDRFDVIEFQATVVVARSTDAVGARRLAWTASRLQVVARQLFQLRQLDHQLGQSRFRDQ